MEEIIKNNVVKTLIVIVIAIMLYILLNIIIKKVINRAIDENAKVFKNQKKSKTYILAFNSIIKYIIFIGTLLIILDINGINVSSLVAGLGIVGIVVGLALQDALKDIIMGKNIVAEHFFQVGDVIKYNDIVGKVESFNMKVTKIRDINTDDEVFITNRYIDKIINVSKWLDINIPAPYERDATYMRSIINNISEKIKKVENVESCEFLGLNEFAPSNVNYKIRIYCMPEYRPTINRKALEIIKNEFDNEKISIPYTQIDIHNV